MYRTVLLSLLLAAPAAVAAQGSSGAAQVEIDLSNFKFTPSAVALQAGKPYVLHLVNKASGGHDFRAKTFFAAARVAPDDAAKIRNGEVELDGGESADIHLIAPAAGSYPLDCSHFLHATFGMKGSIDVR